MHQRSSGPPEQHIHAGWTAWCRLVLPTVLASGITGRSVAVHAAGGWRSVALVVAAFVASCGRRRHDGREISRHPVCDTLCVQQRNGRHALGEILDLPCTNMRDDGSQPGRNFAVGRSNECQRVHCQLLPGLHAGGLRAPARASVQWLRSNPDVAVQQQAQLTASETSPVERCPRHRSQGVLADVRRELGQRDAARWTRRDVCPFPSNNFFELLLLDPQSVPHFVAVVLLRELRRPFHHQLHLLVEIVGALPLHGKQIVPSPALSAQGVMLECVVVKPDGGGGFADWGCTLLLIHLSDSSRPRQELLRILLGDQPR
mmetsp:Transcript_72540/g.193421  ORF Transcript_72540/g.193421 Transcript_72540/m.193421 type:complete len:316 (+) Transcript_72540:637-1584(+)